MKTKYRSMGEDYSILIEGKSKQECDAKLLLT